jgi:LPXTG-motif cell wall-anchored protein
VVPSNPTTPQSPSTPSTTTTTKLPQTGQLNWPVPLMAMSGLLLFAFGWWLKQREKVRHGA